MLHVFILSFLFGFCMKIADLLDEHGLKLFRHADIFFGVAYGVAGAFLFLKDPFLPSLILALIIQWILRYRVDYLNHGVAFAVILVYAFYSKDLYIIDPSVSLFVFFTCLAHGLANDRIDRFDHADTYVKRYFRSNLYVFIISLVLVIISRSYLITALSLTTMFIAYRAANIIGTSLIAKQKTINCGL